MGSSWETAILSNLSAAEDLLDWLEARGFVRCQVVPLPDSTFRVSWSVQPHDSSHLSPDFNEQTLHAEGSDTLRDE